MELKTPYTDGTTHISLSHFELIERLCALVPRPGTHRVRYHGVFASASPHRRLVVPSPAPTTTGPEASANPEAETVSCNEPDPNSVVGKRRRIRRLLWAELLKRTFGVDPKECPDCGRRSELRPDCFTTLLLSTDKDTRKTLLFQRPGKELAGVVWPGDDLRRCQRTFTAQHPEVRWVGLGTAG